MDVPYELPIPREIDLALEKFRVFYIEKLGRAGRALHWNHNFSRGEVRLNYLDKKYELGVSLKQLVVILLFNQRTSLLLSEIIDETGMPQNEVSRILDAFSELGILFSDNEDKKGYWINNGFTNKKIKLKVANTAAAPDLTSESIAVKKNI